MSKILLFENEIFRYKEKSNLILPKVFRNSFLDWGFYGIVVSVIMYIYNQGGLEQCIKMYVR
jgi:hypothetical protein